MAETIKNQRRHMRAYRILKPLLSPLFSWYFNIRALPAPMIEGPCLVLANHNTDLDAVLIHLSFKDLLYFVASEHIFRMGFVSKLLSRYFDPISRLKGSMGVSTAREILKRLKNGSKVCIFAEGNRSFNGLTYPILPSTGKLAKACGAPLITYKFEGGYFTTPRWASTLRRGKMRGYAVNVYTPEQLRAMSEDEVNSAIAADLFEDAYARQALDKTRFKGRRLAEGLETALYLCPICERFGTLHSQGNELSCDCGLSVLYDEFAYLSGAPFHTVTQWDAWQNGKLSEISKNLGSEAAFEDKAIHLRRVYDGHRSEEIYTGPIAMYKSHIACGDYIFNIHDISDMAIYGRANIIFTCLDEHYEIVSDAVFCGLKYLELYQNLKN